MLLLGIKWKYIDPSRKLKMVYSVITPFRRGILFKMWTFAETFILGAFGARKIAAILWDWVFAVIWKCINVATFKYFLLPNNRRASFKINSSKSHRVGAFPIESKQINSPKSQCTFYSDCISWELIKFQLHLLYCLEPLNVPLHHTCTDIRLNPT